MTGRCPHPLCDDPDCRYARPLKSSTGERVWLVIAMVLVAVAVLFFAWLVFVTQVVPR